MLLKRSIISSQGVYKIKKRHYRSEAQFHNQYLETVLNLLDYALTRTFVLLNTYGVGSSSLGSSLYTAGRTMLGYDTKIISDEIVRQVTEAFCIAYKKQNIEKDHDFPLQLEKNVDAIWAAAKKQLAKVPELQKISFAVRVPHYGLKKDPLLEMLLKQQTFNQTALKFNPSQSNTLMQWLDMLLPTAVLYSFQANNINWWLTQPGIFEEIANEVTQVKKR